MERHASPHSEDDVSSWHSDELAAFLKKEDNKPGSSSDRREHIISDTQIPRTDTKKKKKKKSPKKSKSRRRSFKQKKKKPTKQSSSCSASSHKKHKKKKPTKQPSSGSASSEQISAESFADYVRRSPSHNSFFPTTACLRQNACQGRITMQLSFSPSCKLPIATTCDA